MNKVKMINRQFGNEMLVAADRVDEYLAKGHKLVKRYTPPKKPEPNPKPEPAPKAAPKKGRKKKSEKRD